jgi:hypothetical protein
MTIEDPRPDPDLSNYGTGMGPEYEWLISDHPWARAERLRRAADYFAGDELDPEGFPGPEPTPDAPDAVPDLVSDELAGVPASLGDAVGGLVEHVDPVVDRNQLRYVTGDAEPDEVAVDRSRREYEDYRREAGEPEYRYPAHYIGAEAARHAPPSLTPR